MLPCGVAGEASLPKHVKPCFQIVASVDICGVGDKKSDPIRCYTARTKTRIEAKILRIAGSFFLFFIVGRCLVKGTSIVGLRTQGQVIIAADELRGGVDDAGVSTQRTTACKIHAGGNGVYVAIGGTSFKAAPDITLSLDDPLFDNTMRGTREQQVKLAITAFDSKASAVWSRANEINPGFYSRVVSLHAVHLIFGWIDGSKIGAASYSAIPQADGTSSVPQTAFYPNADTPDNTPLVWTVGGAASEIMKSTLQRLSKVPKNLPEFARRLIVREIEADKDHLVVDHPIDVLVVDRSGAHWYNREPQSKCPPIIPERPSTKKPANKKSHK